MTLKLVTSRSPKGTRNQKIKDTQNPQEKPIKTLKFWRCIGHPEGQAPHSPLWPTYLTLSLCFRLYAALLVRNPICCPGPDPPADITAPVGKFNRALCHLHGLSVGIHGPLWRPGRLGLMAQVHFSPMVAWTPHSSGNFLNKLVCLHKKIYFYVFL